MHKTKEFSRKFSYVARATLEDYRWFLLFLIGRFELLRTVYLFISSFKIRFVNQTERLPKTKSCSLFTNLDANKVVQSLRADGIFAGIILPEQLLNKILHYVHTYDCYAGGKTNMGFKISEKDEIDQICTQPFYTARYYNVSTSCSPIMEVVNDCLIQEIATQYLGNHAQYNGTSLYWTFPLEGTSSDADQQHFSKFHYDIDDYACLRFCFYLSKVTADSGAHVCILGSHKKKSLLHTLNFFTRIQSEQELVKLYERERFMTLTGDVGFGFIEDTFCFHRGIVPRKQPRLFLQLHFSVNRYRGAQYHDYRDPSTLKSFKQSKLT